MKPQKENISNKFPKKKYGLTTKPLNTKKNTSLEQYMTPYKNKYPQKESNTYPYKELNTQLKLKLNISLNPDKLKELNMTKLNTKYKDPKFHKYQLLLVK